MKKIYHSPIGEMLLIADKGFLTYCNWIHPDCEIKQNRAKNLLNSDFTGKDEDILMKTENELDEYFTGKREDFQIPVKLIGSPFRKEVWNNLRNVKYGHTLSYKEFAEVCGIEKGYRAVAGACGANPVAIIVPCHRILSSGRDPLGGYTGGLEKKRFLLALEGITV